MSQKFKSLYKRLQAQNVPVQTLLENQTRYLKAALAAKSGLEKQANYLSNESWRRQKEIVDFLTEAQQLRIDPITGAMINVSNPTDPDTGTDNRPDLYWRPAGEQTDGVVEPFPLTPEEYDGIDERHPDADRVLNGQENANDKAEKVVYGLNGDIHLPTSAGVYSPVIRPTSDVTGKARAEQAAVREKKRNSSKSEDGVNVNVHVEAPQIEMPDIHIEQPRQDPTLGLGSVQNLGQRLTDVTGALQSMQIQNTALVGLIQTLKQRIDSLELDQARTPKVIDDKFREINQNVGDIKQSLKDTVRFELQSTIDQKLADQARSLSTDLGDLKSDLQELKSEIDNQEEIDVDLEFDQKIAPVTQLLNILQTEIAALRQHQSDLPADVIKLADQHVDQRMADVTDVVSELIIGVQASKQEIANQAAGIASTEADKVRSETTNKFQEIQDVLNLAFAEIQKVREERKKITLHVKDDVEIVKENRIMTLKTLMESELQQAEVILASKSIVNDLQKMLEQLSNLKVKSLSPVVEQIREQFGIEQADAFNQSVNASIESAADAVQAAKDSVDEQVLVLTGDEEGPTDIEKLVEPESDAPADIEAVSSPSDLGESIRLKVETLKGKTGTKTFESKSKMKAWLNENQAKLKSVKVVK